MKHFLIKWLIAYLIKDLNLDIGNLDPETKKWLAGAWMSPGFRRYIGYREGRIIFELAGGDGMHEITREDYIRTIGYRLECLVLAKHAKEAWKAHEREKKAQMEADQKRAAEAPAEPV